MICISIEIWTIFTGTPEFRDDFSVGFNHSRESKFYFGACYCETTGDFLFPLLYVKNSGDRARAIRTRKRPATQSGHVLQ